MNICFFFVFNNIKAGDKNLCVRCHWFICVAKLIKSHKLCIIFRFIRPNCLSVEYIRWNEEQLRRSTLLSLIIKKTCFSHKVWNFLMLHILFRIYLVSLLISPIKEAAACLVFSYFVRHFFCKFSCAVCVFFRFYHS